MGSLVEFSRYVEEKFSLFITQLQLEMKVSDEILQDILMDQNIRQFLTGQHKIKAKEKVNSDESDKDADGKCIAILKSGDRKGYVCEKKISDKSTTEKYCGMHLKLETTAQVVKKEEEELDGLLFRVNKWGNYAFGETGLILKSATEKRVIGKQLVDGSIVDLIEDDILLCKKRKLRYIKNYSKLVIS